ncbi:hypothetical protein [Mesoplasma lactucae]|uniref:Uncharacterized protein n=1 Tax=Mesoplasma lactucae ATCC 49193 TaxID=81460 RepID=A0A291IRY9_9MOLU|nr:hypothetical protein [Mesoplasma lactucae]ATG97508.1 hypothetical protein CP520_01940 [Mesoplasma lactucae ATCC 49193]ATZ20036.1 hypothetical protein MLACT_v1c02140 [Mesoplasma lactucae ATCC 49193]MCL8217013.1 hypothetical protein [Mesoplasma lactucae ATCC 49193]
MRTNYSTPWFKLEDYLTFNNFDRKKLIQVPKKWEELFDSVEEMWEIITIRIQENINHYFNNFFELIPFDMLNDQYQQWITLALFHTFESIVNGRLPIYSNVELVFSNNSKDYSISNSYKKNFGSVSDMFPPEAIKYLNLTNLRQIQKFKSWDEAFDIWSKNIDDKKLINLKDIKTLIDSLDLTNRNVLKLIQDEFNNQADKNISWRTETLTYIDEKLDLQKIAKNIIDNDTAISKKLAEDINNQVSDIPKIKSEMNNKLNKNDFEIFSNKQSSNSTSFNEKLTILDRKMDELKIKTAYVYSDYSNSNSVNFPIKNYGIRIDQVLGFTGSLACSSETLLLSAFNRHFKRSDYGTWWWTISAFSFGEKSFFKDVKISCPPAGDLMIFSLNGLDMSAHPKDSALTIFYIDYETKQNNKFNLLESDEEVFKEASSKVVDSWFNFVDKDDQEKSAKKTGVK